MLLALLPNLGLAGGDGAVTPAAPETQTGGGPDRSDQFTIREARYIGADDEATIMRIIKLFLASRNRL